MKHPRLEKKIIGDHFKIPAQPWNWTTKQLDTYRTSCKSATNLDSDPLFEKRWEDLLKWRVKTLGIDPNSPYPSPSLVSSQTIHKGRSPVPVDVQKELTLNQRCKVNFGYREFEARLLINLKQRTAHVRPVAGNLNPKHKLNNDRRGIMSGLLTWLVHACCDGVTQSSYLFFGFRFSAEKADHGMLRYRVESPSDWNLKDSGLIYDKIMPVADSLILLRIGHSIWRLVKALMCNATEVFYPVRPKPGQPFLFGLRCGTGKLCLFDPGTQEPFWSSTENYQGLQTHLFDASEYINRLGRFVGTTYFSGVFEDECCSIPAPQLWDDHCSNIWANEGVMPWRYDLAEDPCHSVPAKATP